MAVYVDDMFAPFGNMLMCHMWAGTHDELLAMADLIGVNRRWLQYPSTYKEHFDIAKSKRRLAVAAGAIGSEWREYALAVEQRRTEPSAKYMGVTT